MALSKIGEGRLGTTASWDGLLMESEVRGKLRHHFKKLPEDYGLIDKELPLDIMMRKHFVCDIKNEAVKQTVLAKRNLTLQVPYDMAMTAEATAQQQQDIRNQGTS
ncbi:hypothetical protein MRX96_034547 [Rhipicephalus microplus]